MSRAKHVETVLAAAVSLRETGTASGEESLVKASGALVALLNETIGARYRFVESGELVDERCLGGVTTEQALANGSPF